MRKLLFILTAIVAATNCFAQSPATNSEEKKPYIEVTGTVEREVVPDEIYISISLHERYSGRDKITIEAQEEKLKAAIKSIGIDLSNLYLSDANADYVRVKLTKKDVVANKNYILKVNSASMVAAVFQELDKLDINSAFISKVNHSKIDSINKEVRILAIKAAKDKADYLLAAIGEQTGKALEVEERSTEYISSAFANSTVMTEYAIPIDGSDKDEVQFKKIKVKSSIYVKFQIK